ncbi:MAG: phosphate ABC transporter substrate-binding protein [Candidatus Obscuribacterales bacterium]|nr:phosphate ABC transporter substrate-binding protein [Candidatus Obscuribacterales bacterium]
MRRLRKHTVAASVAIITLTAGAILGCSADSPSDPRSLTPMVSVEGSDTMSTLLNTWAEQFMKAHPDIPVSVTVADSGTGIKALVDKNTDIAASSRDLTDSENSKVHDNGLHLVRRIVALDSIAIIVNPSRTVEEMSMSTLRKIFAGETTNWSSLETKGDGDIVVCVREPESGTSRYFSEHVMVEKPAPTSVAPAKFTKSAKVLNSNDALIEAIATEKNAIGFIGLGTQEESDKKVKVLRVKLLEGSAGVMPTEKSSTNDYSLSRPLYMFFDSKAKESTHKFVDYCLSDEGQAIVREQGFVSLK